MAINFGVARSMGSLAYSALVAVLGTLVEERGILVLPITGEIILAMLLISLIFTKKSYDQARQINEKRCRQQRRSPMGRMKSRSIFGSSSRITNLSFWSIWV